MRYVQADTDEAAAYIAENINKCLKKGPVLLLLSGGSNIKLAVKVRKRLHIENQLTVGLVDERYGPAGHKDSNWAKLLQEGFDTTSLTVMPMLHNESFEQTAHNYSVILASALRKHKYVLGIFGLGPDGHTAGILPDSAALADTRLVSYYIADDYKRITLTPVAFGRISKGFLVAFGKSKKEQLTAFRKKVEPGTQPAQVLKSIKEITVITDQEIN